MARTARVVLSGYVFDATCDHPGCEAVIDRGLSYACGGMHGVYDKEHGIECCEMYFCGEHMTGCHPYANNDDIMIFVCEECCKRIEELRCWLCRSCGEEQPSDLTECASCGADFESDYDDEDSEEYNDDEDLD